VRCGATMDVHRSGVRLQTLTTSQLAAQLQAKVDELCLARQRNAG
jgi:hypothetical protein